MACRWIICPVITATEVDPDTGEKSTYRAAKVYTYIDPTTGKSYAHSAAIDTANWCIAFVRGGDFTPLDADPEIINILEADFANTDNSDQAYVQILQKKPRLQGWNATQLNRLKNRLRVNAVDTSAITLDSPFETILDRAMQKIAPFFRSRSTWVK